MKSKRFFLAFFTLLLGGLSCTFFPNQKSLVDCIDLDRRFNSFLLYPPLYGKEYNAERQKIGLPMIPEDWKSGCDSSSYSTWITPNSAELKSKHIPFYESKTVWYSDGIWSEETDRYYGKNDFECQDGTCREEISITYSFSTESNSKDIPAPGYNPDNWAKGWVVDLSTDQTWNHGLNFYSTSLSDAVKILESWGIQNLDYPNDFK